MRLLLVLFACVGCSLFTEPKPHQFCYPAGADTLGIIKRFDTAGKISECIWLTNDKPVCWDTPQRNTFTCVVGQLLQPVRMP